MKTVSLAYSTREINRNFRIKVSGVDGEGNKVHKLVGVSGAIALIGVEMFNKLLKRAFNNVEDNAYANSAEVLNFHFISNNQEEKIMVINFRKLNRQVLPFKPETKQGFIFIATNEQKENGLFSIAKVGSKRSLMTILVDTINSDEDFKREFSI